MKPAGFSSGLPFLEKIHLFRQRLDAAIDIRYSQFDSGGNIGENQAQRGITGFQSFPEVAAVNIVQVRMDDHRPQYFLVPVQNHQQERIGCGSGSLLRQYVDAPLDLNELLVKNPPATYFVRAAGNSMADAGIQEGDILVVDRSIQPENNAIVIVEIVENY